MYTLHQTKQKALISPLLLVKMNRLPKENKDYLMRVNFFKGFPGGSEGKSCACNAGHPGLITGSRRSLGEGNGNSLQYSCLGNPPWLEEPDGLQSMGSQELD